MKGIINPSAINKKQSENTNRRNQSFLNNLSSILCHQKQSAIFDCLFILYLFIDNDIS